MKANFRFQQKLTFVVQQEERVVCDHNVFDFSRKMVLVQKLGSEGDFVSGLAYSHKLLILGHSDQGQVSLWLWGGS